MTDDNIAPKKSYKDLNVWIETRKLTKEIYLITNSFPKTEQYGIISQMRRCAVSVPSNIAEGCGRNHPKDSVQFFFISRGSLYELETQLYLSFDLNYIGLDHLNQLLIDIEKSRKLLSGFIKYYQQLSR